jgi:hypothetical protein
MVNGIQTWAGTGSTFLTSEDAEVELSDFELSYK